MDTMEAIRKRHSIRKFTAQKIEGDAKAELEAEIAKCNEESGLNIQLVTDDNGPYTGMMARMGGLKNANNYIAVVGPSGAGLDTTGGFYGERVVLKAVTLGMGACWTAGTCNKDKVKFKARDGDKLVIAIALGYPDEPGSEHKSKPVSEVSACDGEMPEWFKNGVESALLAPTGMNRQQFKFTLKDGKVKAEATKDSAYSAIDLGIAKYHFEVGAGKDSFEWA